MIPRGRAGYESTPRPTPEGKAVRRFGARMAKTDRWANKPSNKVAYQYGDGMAKHFERPAPYFQHQPTGLYVQQHSTVMGTDTRLTGDVQYSVPGMGRLAVIKHDELRPAPHGMDVLAAARHNRTMTRGAKWPGPVGRLDYLTRKHEGINVRWDDILAEALKKSSPLLGKTTNMFGPTSQSPDVHQRLRAVLSNPTHDTWDNAHGIVVSQHGGLGGTTLWQAVLAVDPSFPNVGPRSDASGRRLKGWDRIPDQMTLARAIKHATSLKPRR